MTLRFSGLPGSMSNEQFYEMLLPLARIDSAHIVYDPVTRKSKRFGFAIVNNLREAERLLLTFDGNVLPTGQILRVTEHKSRKHSMQSRGVTEKQPYAR